MMRKDDIRRELSAPAASPQPNAGGTTRTVWLAVALRVLAAAVLAVVSLTLVYQIPVTHTVDIGGYDAAYVQGFYEPEQSSTTALQGSDGSARWTHDISDLIFPQAGTPAHVTLHWRAAQGKATDVQVLLNGTIDLGTAHVTDTWQEQSFTINAGLLKPNDVVIELRSATAPISKDDMRSVGVLLDRATYRVGPAPITPYPAQLAYGAFAAACLWLLFRPTTNDQRPTGIRFVGSRRLLLGSWLLVLAAWFFLYRSQPLYPYPLRSLLPAIDLVLGAALVLRYGPTLVQRIPTLFDALALGGVAVWLIALLRTAQGHTVLSLPGVENDFRVFALRSGHLFGSFPQGTTNPDLDGVLRADGFYNLLYPLLLWLVRPLTHDNPFLAAQWVAAGSAAVLLLATWWLARAQLGRGVAVVVLFVLAFSPLFVQYALYIGTDMPFAALCMLALALLLRSQGSGEQEPRTENQKPRGRAVRRSHRVILSSRHLIILAGIAAGGAFLVRHPGILLLPVGWLAISFKFSVLNFELPSGEHRPETRHSKLKTQHLLLFTVAFLLTISPQLVVNTLQTGNPLFNQQAKNIWLSSYAGGDWGRWGEVPDSIPLTQVVGRDPARVLANWWTNVRGFVGAGGEQTSEFERAIQLRLLGFPANWLALAGLLGWMIALLQRWGNKETPTPLQVSVSACLLAWIALYVLAVSAGIGLPRFFLPLVPVYALAAGAALVGVGTLGTKETQETLAAVGGRRSAVGGILSLILLALLWGGFANGANYVLGNQAADEVAAVQLVQSRVPFGEQLIICGKDAKQWCGYTALKYSAIAHLAVSPPKSNDTAALRASGAQYMITSNVVAPQGATLMGRAGAYTLYRFSQ